MRAEGEGREHPHAKPIRQFGRPERAKQPHIGAAAVFERQDEQLEIEFGQLQLEQSTWAMHARIENIAARKLGMRVPPASRVQVVAPSRGEETR